MSIATSSTHQQLSEAAQVLVDARLDTIERMLLGRVPRGDRLAILRDVETQILEQLREREAEELTREEVLEVLRNLDPPEAFLPEGEGAAFSMPMMASLPARPPLPTPRAATATATATSTQETAQRLGRISGILGVVSLALVVAIPLMYVLAMVANNEFVLFGGILGVCGLMFLGGVTSFVLALVARVSGAWAVVGLITGVFATLFSLLPALYLVLALLMG
jgi:hypothetical protein